MQCQPDVLNGARPFDVGYRNGAVARNADARRDFPALAELAAGDGAGAVDGHTALAFGAGEVFRADRARLSVRKTREIAQVHA